MISLLLIIFSVLFLIFALLDLKNRAIPSILLTGTLIVLLFIKFSSFQYALIFGMLGILMWEFSTEKKVAFGVADIKMMFMMGFFVSSLPDLMILIGAFGIGQVFYIFAIDKFTKFKEIPFIPFLLTLWIGAIIGGIIR